MMEIKTQLLVPMCIAALLAACGTSGFDDLEVFMAEAKARPANRIDPAPTFNPYKPFEYSATMLRGPFDPPITIVNITPTAPNFDVKPDDERPREFLEQFNIESLQMVGTLEKKNQLWALLQDSDSNVHYVKNDNYIGKNHGRIIQTAATHIQVLEVIAVGGGWVERPRTIELQEAK